MEYLASIAEWSVAAFGLLLAAIQLLTHEIGFQLGRRQKDLGAGHHEGVGIVTGGMLGLLAFVLALTLSFSNSRFTDRRAGTLAEANAIGTAWLRAKAVGGPHAEQIAGLMEQYAQLRKDFVTAGRSRAKIDALNQRTNSMQTIIWGHLTAVVREQPNPVSAALMTAINEAFDMSVSERFAFNMRLPPQLFWLLVFMLALSTGMLGYQFGLKGQPLRGLIALLTLMWTAVIIDILDLGSARLGNLRTDPAVYEWTIQSFGSGASTMSPTRPR